MALESRLEIRVSAAERRTLELLAAARRWPLGTFVRELLREGVDREVAALEARRAAEPAQSGAA